MASDGQTVTHQSPASSNVGSYVFHRIYVFFSLEGVAVLDIREICGNVTKLHEQIRFLRSNPMFPALFSKFWLTITEPSVVKLNRNFVFMTKIELNEIRML